MQAAPYALAAWLVVSGRAEGTDSGWLLATIFIVGRIKNVRAFGNLQEREGKGSSAGLGLSCGRFGQDGRSGETC